MTQSRHLGATPANPRHTTMCHRPSPATGNNNNRHTSTRGHAPMLPVAAVFGALLLLAAAPPLVAAAPEYRLSGVCSFEPRAGRLELQPNVSAEFGTVCDDSFDETAALGACRSLGFADTVRAHVFAAPGGTGPIYADGVRCPTNASGLDACTLLNGDVALSDGAGAVTSCTHAEDVGIQCVAGEDSPSAPPSWEYRLTGGGGIAGQGLLEVRPSASVAWGSVCGGSFSVTEGLVACRALGHTHLTSADVHVSARDPVIGDGDAANDALRNRTYLSLVDCGSSVNASRLEQCAHVPVPYAHCRASEAVYLECGGRTFTYRLTDGHATMGAVEVKTAPRSSWRGVCDDSFDRRDALIACRSVGFADATHAIVVDYWTYMPEQFNAYAMDEVECTGHERSLDECYYETDSDCDEEDVAVQCFGPSASAAHAGTEYRVDGTSGLVEVRRDGMSWGRIVYRGGIHYATPDQRFANAVCTASGASLASGASVRFWLERSSDSSRAVSMVAGTCAELPSSLNVSRPDECFWATYARRLGDYDFDLHVDCGVSVTWGFSLVAGEIPGVGVAMAHSSATGEHAVTGDTRALSHGAARAMCEAMGITDTWAPFLYTAANPNTPLPAVRISSVEGSIEVSAAAESPPNGILCTTTAQAAAWEYRLVNGTATSGALEVRPTGTSAWGTVAVYHYTQYSEPVSRLTAKLLCRALGLPDANASTFEVPYANMSESRVYWYNLQCDGSERNPAECVATPYPRASAGGNGRGALGVTCGGSGANDWKYRLAGGGSNWGRLEIQLPDDDQWFTVPRHRDYELRYDNARNVACRSLGYGPLATGTLMRTTGGGGDLLQKKFDCFGGAQSELALCEVTSYTVGAESVSLSCDENNTPEAAAEPRFDEFVSSPGVTTARTLIFDGLSGPVSVCSPNRDVTAATASVLCGFDRFVGGSAALSYGEENPESLAGLRIADLVCPVGSTSLAQCTYTVSETAGCRSNDYVHVVCTPHATSLAEASRYWATHKYGFVLESADGATKSPSSGAGRLLARVNLTAAWGPVCRTAVMQAMDDGDHFALAACRSAGYGSSVAGYLFSAAKRAGSVVQLADPHCVSGSPTLDHCRLSTAAAAAGIASPCANASSVVGVQCVRRAGEQQAWEYRLHGPDQLLEMRAAAGGDGAAWGTVCSDSELGPLAALACSALGLSTEDPVAYLVDASAADLAKPVHMSGVSCGNLAEGASATPESCRHVPRGFATCASGRRVGLRCGRGGPRYAGVRLSGSTFPGSGLVEVQTTAAGAYAPVCSGPTRDDAAALAVCRSLGYVSTTVVATWVSRTAVLAPGASLNALGYLRCRAGYEDASDCTFDTPVGFDGSCSENEVLGVSCIEPEGAVADGVSFKLDNPATTSAVRVRLNASAPWMPVCYSSGTDFIDFLGVLCRSLGFAGGNAGRGVMGPADVGDFRFESSCPPGATNVSQCKASYGSLATTGTKCSQLQLLCSAAPIEYRFQDGGIAPHTGIVWTRRMWYENGRTFRLLWWPVTVAATLLPGKQALGAMVCRSMGYGDASINVPASALSLDTRGVQLWSFRGSTGNPVGSADSFAYTSDRHHLTVVNCSAALQRTVWETQLALDGDVPGRGLLQVRPRTADNSAYWGGIVAETIPATLARGLCVSLGYSGGGVVVPRHPGTGSRIVYIQTLRCPSGAQSLAECAWSSSGMSSGARNAGLQCYNGTAAAPSAGTQLPSIATCVFSGATPVPMTTAPVTTLVPQPDPTTLTTAPATTEPRTTGPATTLVPATSLPTTIEPPTTFASTTVLPPSPGPTTMQPTVAPMSVPPTTPASVLTQQPSTARPPQPSHSMVKPSPVPMTSFAPTGLPVPMPSPSADPIMTPSIPPATQASRSTVGGSADGDVAQSAGIAAGTTIGVLVLVASVVAIVIISRKHRQHQQDTAAAEPHTQIQNGRVGHRNPHDPQGNHVDFPSSAKVPENQFFEMSPVEDGVHSPTFAVNVNSGDNWAVRPRRSHEFAANVNGGEEHCNPIPVVFDAHSVRSSTGTVPDDLNQDASLVRGREE